MKYWLTRSMIIGICGSVILIVSGYTEFPLLLAIAGVFLMVLAAGLATFGLILGRGKIFGATRRMPQAMLFAKSLGALGITIASVVILTLSGYHARPGGLLIYGGAVLLMAIVYWVIAAVNYKKNRQREKGV